MSDNIKFSVAVVGVIALVAFVVYAEKAEKERWAQYAKENECKVIATKQATGHWIRNAQGDSEWVTIRGTSTWKCSDGVEHTRNNWLWW